MRGLLRQSAEQFLYARQNQAASYPRPARKIRWPTKRLEREEPPIARLEATLAKLWLPVAWVGRRTVEENPSIQCIGVTSVSDIKVWNISANTENV